MKRLILSFLLISSAAYAGQIEHINYLTVEINGVEYQVPDANREYKEQIYYLKKALRGDKEALEILVGESEYATLWIGDIEPRWVKVYKDGRAEVVNP